MTGAKAAMDRAFATRDRNALGTERIEALTALTAQVRELNYAVIHTDLPPAEVTEITALLADLTDRLGSATREAPPIVAAPDGTIRQPISPVSGYLNPISPPVEIHSKPGGVSRAEFTLSDVYVGPPSFVHGGVSALILDELLGSAAAANGTPGMTAILQLRYRRPTPLGVPLVAEARVTRVEGRKTFVDATLTNPQGQVTIEATAMFIMPSR